MLDHQPLTLLVAVGTLVLTVLLYIVIPKGFFPLQDTGFIQGITEAGPTVSSTRWRERQQALADEILKDPDVASLSSFIGVDGTNNTLNSGRFLINLKPKDERDGVADGDRTGLADDAHSVPGITLLSAAGAGPDHRFHGQPRPVSVRAAGRDRSRRSNSLVPKLLDQLRQAAGAAQRLDHLPGQGPVGLSGRRPRHRGALRHHRRDHRQCALRRLRPAHHLHHLHPVQPVPRHPGGRSQPAEFGRIAERHLSAVGGRRAGAAVGHRPDRAAPVPLEIDHLGQFPAATISFDVAPGYSLGAAVDAVQQAETDAGMPASITTQFQGSALAFQSALATNCC